MEVLYFVWFWKLFVFGKIIFGLGGLEMEQIEIKIYVSNEKHVTVVLAL